MVPLMIFVLDGCMWHAYVGFEHEDCHVGSGQKHVLHDDNQRKRGRGGARVLNEVTDQSDCKPKAPPHQDGAFGFLGFGSNRVTHGRSSPQ